MQKHEAKFQVLFKHWLAVNIPEKTTCFELKQTKTDILRKDALLPHQKQSLINAKHHSIYHKLPDDTIGYKPFDCFFITEADSLIIIKFKSGVIAIDIDEYIKVKGSLYYAKALEIGKKLW